MEHVEVVSWQQKHSKISSFLNMEFDTSIHSNFRERIRRIQYKGKTIVSLRRWGRSDKNVKLDTLIKYNIPSDRESVMTECHRMQQLSMNASLN